MKKLILSFVLISSLTLPIHLACAQQSTQDKVIEMVKNHKGETAPLLGDTIEKQIVGTEDMMKKTIIEWLDAPDEGERMLAQLMYPGFENVSYQWTATSRDNAKDVWLVSVTINHPNRINPITREKFPMHTYNFKVNLSKNTISGDKDSAPHLIGFDKIQEIIDGKKNINWEKETTVPLQ